MSDTLGGKFNFYYLAETMVTDGIFVDAGKDKVVDNIVDKLQTWYIAKINDKVTDAGITTSTVEGWKDVMEKVDMQTIWKNGRYLDLIDANSFNVALTKYIEKPHENIEDSNFFIIYLNPDNLYPK